MSPITVWRNCGVFGTDDKHVDPRKRSGIERGSAWMLNKASLIGPHTGRWAEQMLQQRGIEGVRVLLGLLNLSNRHSTASIEQACEAACTHGVHRLHTIRELIDRQSDRQEQLEFMDEHPIIRSGTCRPRPPSSTGSCTTPRSSRSPAGATD